MKSHKHLLYAAIGFLPAIVDGQVSESSQEEFYELSAFEVVADQDSGYRATNAISATGLGTRIIDTPLTISVLTREFLDDLVTDELWQVGDYASGVTTNIRDTETVLVRGFGAPTLINRLNFAGAVPTDAVGRIEVVKGPNSIFFGAVQPGGIVNMILPRPRFTDWTGRLETKYGSYDYKKAKVEVSGPLIDDKLAVLAIGSIVDREFWKDYTGLNQDLFLGAITWRPTERSSITLTGLDLDQERQEHRLDYLASHPAYLEANPPFNVSLTTWVRNNIGPNEPPQQIDVSDQLHPKGHRYNPMGPESFDDQESQTVFLEGQSKIGDNWEAQAKFFWQDKRDQNLFYNTFRPRADLTFFEQPRLNIGRVINRSSQFELTGELDFEAMTHRLLAGYEWKEFRSQNPGQQRGTRRHWNPRTDPVRNLLKEFLEDFPEGIEAQLLMEDWSISDSSSFYLTDQIEMWDNKLRILAGARRTETTSFAEETESETNPQVGALIRPWGSAFTMFANYSETFEPNFSVDAFGNQLENVSGEGYELGVKTDWKDNTLSGTFTLFQVERSNIAQHDFNREQELDIFPIFNFGGVERVSGLEVDLIWTPIENYQAIFAYTYNDERETIENTDSPNQVGIPLWGVPEHRVSFWNKYRFTEGQFKGMFVGFGVQTATDFTIHPSWQTTARESYTIADALIGYETTFREQPMLVQLNINNLTDEEYFDHRLSLGQPLEAILSLRLDF